MYLYKYVHKVLYNPLLIWNESWVNKSNIEMCRDRLAVNLNWGLINSHYLCLSDKWNDLLSSFGKFNQIPASIKNPMWKMDRFSEPLGLESRRLTKGEAFSIPKIFEDIWGGGIFQLLSWSYASSNHPSFLPIPGSQRKQPLTYIYIMIFIFSIIAGLQCSVNFPLYSMATQLHIHVYIIFSHIIILHHKWPDRVPSATQQDLIANTFVWLTA